MSYRSVQARRFLRLYARLYASYHSVRCILLDEAIIDFNLAIS
jgi:hypothetical protein